MTKFRHHFPVMKFWHMGMLDKKSFNYRLKMERADLWDWMTEQTFFDTWSLEVEVIESEYDTGQTLYQMSIRYKDINDAFSHRMRW